MGEGGGGVAGGEHSRQVQDEEILPSQARPQLRISRRPDYSSQCSILCKFAVHRAAPNSGDVFVSQGMMNKMRLAGPDVLNSGNLFVQTRQPDQRVFETKTVISFIIIPIILSWL